MKNPVPAPAGFAIKIRQNPAGFEKSKSGTTLHQMQTLHHSHIHDKIRLPNLENAYCTTSGY